MHPILFVVTMVAAASMLAGTDAMAQSSDPATKTDRLAAAKARSAIPLPNRALLAPPAQFNCELKAATQSQPGPAPAQADLDAGLRAKLEYERQCYRHAEMILRDRLLGLQAAVGETIKAVNSRNPPTVKQPKRRSVQPQPQAQQQATPQAPSPQQ